MFYNPLFIIQKVKGLEILKLMLYHVILTLRADRKYILKNVLDAISSTYFALVSLRENMTQLHPQKGIAHIAYIKFHK